jgi:hypothetical protein
VRARVCACVTHTLCVCVQRARGQAPPTSASPAQFASSMQSRAYLCTCALESLCIVAGLHPSVAARKEGTPALQTLGAIIRFGGAVCAENDGLKISFSMPRQVSANLTWGQVRSTSVAI